MSPAERRVPVLAGVAALVIGVTVLVGHLTGQRLLMQMLTDYPAPKANTALMLILAGVSLLIPRHSRWRYLPAVALTGIAGATLVEWIADVDVRIDQILVTDTGRTTAPGRPAPELVAAFAAFGLARGLDGLRRRRAIASSLSTAAFVAIVFAVELGYLYDAHELTGREAHTGVAVPTAAALAALAVGLITLTADRPPVAWLRARGTVGRLARRLLLLTMFAPPVVGWLVQAGQQVGWYSVESQLVLFASAMAVILTATTVGVIARVAKAEAGRERLAGELAATFEHLPASMTLRDVNGIFLRANRTFAQHTNFDPDTIVGQPMEAIYPDHILPWAKAEVAEVLEAGVATQSEYDADLGEGPRTFDVTRYPVVHADGTLIGVGTFTIDITDRKRAELALAAAEERYRTDLDLAGIVQRQLLLAPTPVVDGYDIASAFLPASQVTGDFYDLWMPDGEVRIVVADVMGKGVGAAIIGSAIRAILHASLTFALPSQAMARASADLDSDLTHTSRFATCFAARLDPVTGLLRWVDAGHGLALILRTYGEHEWLRSDDLPVGAMTGSSWTERTTELAPGDVLLIASDGLLDQVSEADDVIDLARRHDVGDAQTLLDHIAAACTVRDDDITLVAIRRAEPA